MEDVAYMVCMRTDEVDDPVEGSKSTACVECGTDIWISVESRKEAAAKRAFLVCTKCALRMASEDEGEWSGEPTTPSTGQFEELKRELAARGITLPEEEILAGLGPFERLKTTAGLASQGFIYPTDSWGSMAIFEPFDGEMMEPIPISKILDSGMPKHVLAHQMLPSLAFAASAKRVMIAIDSWGLTFKGHKKEDGMPTLSGPISEHKDREEMLLLIEITGDGVQNMTTAPIIRDGINPPTLGEWEDSEDPGATDGLFVEALVPTLAIIKKFHELDNGI